MGRVRYRSSESMGGAENLPGNGGGKNMKRKPCDWKKCYKKTGEGETERLLDGVKLSSKRSLNTKRRQEKEKGAFLNTNNL